MKNVFFDADSQSDSSDTTSTMKRNGSKETTSEVYDSSATSSTSEVGDEYHEEYQRNVDLEFPGPPADCRSQSCLCQVEYHKIQTPLVKFYTISIQYIAELPPGLLQSYRVPRKHAKFLFCRPSALLRHIVLQVVLPDSQISAI